MKCGDIIVSNRKNNLLSMLIRWWTNSHWSHVRIMLNKDKFIEATYPRVRIGGLSELTGETYRILTPRDPLSCVEQGRLHLYLRDLIGRKYDWRGVLSFVTHKNVQKKNWYFCSELAADAYASIGKPLFRREGCWITPQDIYQTLELSEVN